jgi:hypothetical protein
MSDDRSGVAVVDKEKRHRITFLGAARKTIVKKDALVISVSLDS